MKLNKKKFIKAIMLLLFILVLFLLLVLEIFIKYNYVKIEKIDPGFKYRVKTLEDFETDFIKIGWLQVQGTNIDLPILDFTASETDQDYSFGWRSGLYSTGENREVLVGHNIINVSSEPMLSNDSLQDFEALMSFVYAGFAKDNLYIKYTKDGNEDIYLIYAVGFYDYGYDNAESYSNKNMITKYISTVRENSIYDYDVDVNNTDTLLTVKTCTRYFGLNEKQQIFIDARKLRDNEEMVKYSVNTNKLFDELLNSKEIN